MCIRDSVSAEHVMDMTDQRERIVDPAQSEEVADRERVGPQIPSLRLRAGQPGAIRKARHQLGGRHGASGCGCSTRTASPTDSACTASVSSNQMYSSTCARSTAWK